jgi:hypothetical protein
MQMAGLDPSEGELQFVDCGQPHEVRVLPLVFTEAQVERVYVHQVAQPISRHITSDDCTVLALGAADP